MRFDYKIGFSSKWILTDLRSYCAKDVLLEPSPDAGRAYILGKKKFYNPIYKDFNLFESVDGEFGSYRSRDYCATLFKEMMDFCCASSTELRPRWLELSQRTSSTVNGDRTG